MADPFVGKRIREYEILEVIGQSRTGALYRARHVLLEQERAVKIVQTGITGSSELADRFIREARVLARMRHPNLVELYEFGTLEDGALFMILELLEGETVRSCVEREKKLPVPEAAHIAREAALGLHVAHGMGMIHRDLCPDNLYLMKTASGAKITKVIDFAIAKPTAQEARTMKITPILPGRPEFWSPEQFGIEGQEVALDPRTDVYSLGATLYFMVSGRLPFLSLVPKGTPEPFVMGQVPHRLETLIWKALALDRDRRQQSMMDFITELDEAMHGEPTPTSVMTRPVTRAQAFQPGFVFANRYTIEKKLGRGGMGTVFKATDRILEIAVALKTINPEVSSDEKVLARLKREVILARKVAHPNVCRLYDIGESDGVHYVSMEFVDGMTLSDILLLRGRLPQDEGLKILRQVILALQQAHRAGVIHRDLKPQNIMVDTEQHAFIMDFGISFSEEVTRLTTTGMMIGTPRYMAPEQFGEGATDERADIYSMGVILYEVFTGRLPFDAKTPASLMYAHLHSPPAPPTRVVPDISPELEQVILKALEKDPARRYQNAGELLQAVDAVLASQTEMAEVPPARKVEPPVRKVAPAAPPPEAPPSTPMPPVVDTGSIAATPQPGPPPERTLVAPFALAIFGFLALAIVGWYYFLRPQPPVSVQGTQQKQETPQTIPGTTPAQSGPITVQPQTAAATQPAVTESTTQSRETIVPGVEPPAQVTVHVTSDPAGAAIFLNGGDTGLTTPSNVPLSNGENRVELRLQGYEPAAAPVSASTPEMHLALAKTPVAPPPAGPGKITYQGKYPVSVYSGRKLLLNTAKADSIEIPAGTYELTLVATEKVIIRSIIKVEVRPGETTEIPAPEMATLQLTATPTNCKIYIDTVFVDVSPIFDFPIQAGNHHVRVQWEALGKEKSGFFTVATGQTIRLRALADDNGAGIFEQKQQ